MSRECWKERFDQWMKEEMLAPELKEELSHCSVDEKELKERFYRSLEFGTGGLRGKLGAGTNRMNVHTVSKVTMGLAAYLKKKEAAPSCAIAYDSRNKSRLFAETAAGVLAEQGIKVWIYPELKPTPMLSFAVRYLKCSGGIVITASHNPAVYNGYKVYGPDGCQITLAAAVAVSEEISRQTDFVPIPDFDRCVSEGTVQYISREVEEAYDKEILSLRIRQTKQELQIVYSPLNGTGNIPVRRVLSRMGGMHVTVVPEQELPDGNFPTCPYPNPEEPAAMEAAARLARSTGADLFLATDPDCDRVGAGIVLPGGEYRLFNGNEMGILLFDYICEGKKAAGTMPEHPLAVKTIVTTPMAEAVADEYGVELRNVLTGFKFIGEQIGLLDAAKETGRYVFGFEESCGCLSGSAVRDKDGVNAAMLICEMAAYYKEKGKTLEQALEGLYEKYGYYLSRLITFELPGAEGMSAIKAMMQDLRESGKRTAAGMEIKERKDYLRDGTGLPASDVLEYRLGGECSVIVRPSGTEPKIKFYLTARGTDGKEASKKITQLSTECRHYFETQMEAERMKCSGRKSWEKNYTG